MNDHAVFTRRGFLKLAAGTAAGGAAACILPEFAEANVAYRPIRYALRHNFNATEVNIIRQAVNLVAHRMLDGRMFAWTRPRYRQWYASAPGRTLRSRAEFEAWFYRIQLAALSTAGFAPLYIHGQYDASGAWAGHARVGLVRADYYVRNGRQQPAVTGAFNITLNTALLGSSRFHLGRNPSYWAGVITHEMLHNLGHQHPVNVYDGVFMRVYQNAVQFNADPRR